MLKILCLPATSSAIFILSFFPAAGVTQEHSGCFMVTSSGQIVNLENICVNKKRVHQDYQSKPDTTKNMVDDLSQESVASPHKETSRFFKEPEEAGRFFKESEDPNVVSVGPDGTKYYSNGDQLLPNGTIRRVRFGD